MEIPRITIIQEPTPVRRLDKLFPDNEVWIKDDSQSHPVYGGNKPRKLEYLLAQAKARNQEVVTFGFESSNHAVATAYHCAQQGIPCHLILVRGPERMSTADENSKTKKLKLVHELSKSVKVVDGFSAAFRAGFWKWAAGFGKVMWIPPGGSNALGTVGYIRAGYELADQIKRGELPEPRYVHVPLGTGSTALGLAIGLRACGLRSSVIASKVVPGPVNERLRLRWLAYGVGKILPDLPREALDLSNLIVDRSALGEGYGIPTPPGMRAVDQWSKLESVQLESTYSGKAAATLEKSLIQESTDGPILFWLTYSEYRAR